MTETKTGAALVHDLRLPLQVIYGCAEMLEELEEGGPYPAMLLESEGEARRLLDGYLHTWQEGGAPFCPEAGELVSLTRGIASRWHAYAQRRKVCLRFKCNVARLSFAFDGEWISRALQNMLANALRYAPAGSTVRLTLEALGDYVELGVCDEGPGLLNGAAPDGFGLGLEVVRECARLHGGTMRLQPGQDGGCVCLLRLPAVCGAGGPQEVEARGAKD